MRRQYQSRGDRGSRHGERGGIRRVGPKVETYFWQKCPACGRTLRIRVEHLGCEVVCRHCGRRFTALDETLWGAKCDALLSPRSGRMPEPIGRTRTC